MPGEDSRWELIKQRESIDLTAGLERRLRLPVRESRGWSKKFASEKGSRDCCVGTPSRLGANWPVLAARCLRKSLARERARGT